jgi:biotin operon repressor
MEELRRMAPGVVELVELFAVGHDAICAPDGSWMWVAGEFSSLDGKPVTQRLISTLLAAREPVSVDVLGEQLWPGEFMTDDSLRTRVRTHVHRLRKTGLDVQFAEDGYLLRSVVAAG